MKAGAPNMIVYPLNNKPTVKHSRTALCTMKIVGIDLAGVENRQTGFCIMDSESLQVKTMVFYSDREIINKTLKVKPDLVSIDAPLGLPRVRCCLRSDCACRNTVHLREYDGTLYSQCG